MNIIILGAGSTAISVTDIIQSSKIFNIKGYVGTETENQKFKNKNIYKDIPFLGGKESLKNIPKIFLLVLYLQLVIDILEN